MKILRTASLGSNFTDSYNKKECRSVIGGKTNGVRIRSKVDWYEYGEKSTKFFLNLEKIWARQDKIRNVLKNWKEITDQRKVNNELFDFYNNLFKSDKRRPKHVIAQFYCSSVKRDIKIEQCTNCEILMSIFHQK